MKGYTDPFGKNFSETQLEFSHLNKKAVMGTVNENSGGLLLWCTLPSCLNELGVEAQYSFYIEMIETKLTTDSHKAMDSLKWKCPKRCKVSSQSLFLPEMKRRTKIIT